MAVRVGRAALGRARVHAQFLDERRAEAGSAAGVVSRVVGVQAQDYGAAALSVRARTSGLDITDVDDALGDHGSMVLTWSLRGTRHLHCKGDVRWLVGLLGPRFGSPGAAPGSSESGVKRATERWAWSGTPLPPTGRWSART